MEIVAEDAPADPATLTRQSVQNAVAALLVETANADRELKAAELRVVGHVLQRQFGVGVSDSARLIERAQREIAAANDVHQFTSPLCQHLAQAERIEVIEALWRVAFADAHLDAHENHFIRKVAGLLYVGQSAYIHAKIRAQQPAG